jgi:hypothetical protein
MLFNVMLLVKGLTELARPAVLAEVNSGNLPMPDLRAVVNDQSKMSSIKGKFEVDHAANLGNLKRRATGEVSCPDGLSTRDRQRKALSYWFSAEEERESQEKSLNDRLDAAARATRLPMLEPLPSSEDCFLAWTSEDEYLFDRPVKESWRNFEESSNSLVKVEYVHQSGQSSFAPEENSQSNLDALAEVSDDIGVGTAYHGGNLTMPSYWVD